MKKLEGKVALVTGAARGIGAAIAERLAADGASVAVNYAKSKEDAEALAERIRGNGGKAKAIHADIGNPSQAKAFVDAAVKEFGRLDILVNNAGKFHIGPDRNCRRSGCTLAVRCKRRWANLCDAGRRVPLLHGGWTGHQRQLNRRDTLSPRPLGLFRNQGGPRCVDSRLGGGTRS